MILTLVHNSIFGVISKTSKYVAQNSKDFASRVQDPEIQVDKICHELSIHCSTECHRTFWICAQTQGKSALLCHWRQAPLIWFVNQCIAPQLTNTGLSQNVPSDGTARGGAAQACTARGLTKGAFGDASRWPCVKNRSGNYCWTLGHVWVANDWHRRQDK
jgi:hypothetical protein